MVVFSLVHMDAAHEVMLGRGDGDAFSGHVIAFFQAPGVNIGEMVFNFLFADGTQIFPYKIRAVGGHLGADGFRQQIPGHQFIGKAFAFGVVQQRALAADRFGDEKTPPWLFGIERSGMNLHIVDIFQRHAVLHAYGQAVPG